MYQDFKCSHNPYEYLSNKHGSSESGIPGTAGSNMYKLGEFVGCPPGTGMRTSAGLSRPSKCVIHHGTTTIPKQHILSMYNHPQTPRSHKYTTTYG